MTKKTFALKMKGLEIKTLENLRENFDLEIAVQYFKSGELLDWLEDRFYDDEAEKIENISPDDKNLSQKICAALGVDCDDDVEFIQRVREKKNILSEKTDDENIINNAATTALNQDDLANLLHMDYSTIFLCGESFNVPIRVENKKYIGVLSTPKIKIRANSDAELAEKNISFENCRLPWTKETPIVVMKVVAQKIFGTKGEWLILDKDNVVVSTYDKLSTVKKNGAVDLCCQKKYKEEDIVFMMIRDDFSDGIAFTADSFCRGGALGKKIIKYDEINSVDAGSRLYVYGNRGIYDFRGGMFEDNEELNTKIKKFLYVVKKF